MKTLKDLNQGRGLEVDGRVYSNGKVTIEDLRQEAIAWIKGHKNNALEELQDAIRRQIERGYTPDRIELMYGDFFMELRACCDCYVPATEAKCIEILGLPVTEVHDNGSFKLFENNKELVHSFWTEKYSSSDTGLTTETINWIKNFFNISEEDLAGK